MISTQRAMVAARSDRNQQPMANAVPSTVANVATASPMAMLTPVPFNQRAEVKYAS